jgi:hypothetical protein
MYDIPLDVPAGEFSPASGSMVAGSHLPRAIAVGYT